MKLLPDCQPRKFRAKVLNIETILQYYFNPRNLT
jgi:hypothetical protein